MSRRDAAPRQLGRCHSQPRPSGNTALDLTRVQDSGHALARDVVASGRVGAREDGPRRDVRRLPPARADDVVLDPGSTEVPFLAGLPDDLRFVLALHEGPVVALATGFANGRGEPALAIVHTTAGLGNAVGALATARVNRAPLVVLVGQQDRRHLAFTPFLSGRLDGLAGDYPVSVEQPVRPQEVPGAIDRAYHAAATHRGPALVIVPMDDWEAPAEDEREDAAAGRVLRGAGVDPDAVDALAAFLKSSDSPALVVGAGADDARRPRRLWSSLRSGSSFPCSRSRSGARRVPAGPSGSSPGSCRPPAAAAREARAVRRRARRRRARVPAVAVRGGPVHGRRHKDRARQRRPGRSPPQPRAARRPRSAGRRLPRAPRGARARARTSTPPSPFAAAASRAERPTPRGHVLAALASACRAMPWSSKKPLSTVRSCTTGSRHREPLGFLSAAMGGLGFALGGATGVRMALPERPVVAVVGDRVFDLRDPGALGLPRTIASASFS